MGGVRGFGEGRGDVGGCRWGEGECFLCCFCGFYLWVLLVGLGAEGEVKRLWIAPLGNIYTRQGAAFLPLYSNCVLCEQISAVQFEIEIDSGGASNDLTSFTQSFSADRNTHLAYLA